MGTKDTTGGKEIIDSATGERLSEGSNGYDTRSWSDQRRLELGIQWGEHRLVLQLREEAGNLSIHVSNSYKLAKINVECRRTPKSQILSLSWSGRLALIAA